MNFDIFTVINFLPESWRDKASDAVQSIDEVMRKTIPFFVQVEVQFTSPRSRPANGDFWWFPSLGFGRNRQAEKHVEGNTWKVVSAWFAFLGLQAGIGFCWRSG